MNDIITIGSATMDVFVECDDANIVSVCSNKYWSSEHIFVQPLSGVILFVDPSHLSTHFLVLASKNPEGQLSTHLL